MTSTQNKSLQRHKDSAFAQLIYESKFCINNNNEGNEAQLIKCIKRNMNEIIVGLVRRPNEHDDEDHNKFTFYVLNNNNYEIKLIVINYNNKQICDWYLLVSNRSHDLFIKSLEKINFMCLKNNANNIEIIDNKCYKKSDIKLIKKIGDSPGIPMVIIDNNIIHFICDKGIHYVWDLNKKEIIENFNFGRISSFNNKAICSASLIHVKSKNQIILISAQFDTFEKNQSTGFWVYCLIKKKWTNINKLINNNTISMNIENPSCNLTLDQKHIIITNGFYWEDGCTDANDITYSPNIYILTITNETKYQLTRSRFKLPNLKSNNCIIMGGEKEHELCVFGWCNSILNIYIPHVILLKILSYYNQQELHCITHSSKHYSIPIKMILASSSHHNM